MHKKILKTHIDRILASLLVFMIIASPITFSEDKTSGRELRKEFKKRVQQGRRYYRKKLYKEAIGELEKAHEIYPKKRFVERIIRKSRELLKNKSFSGITEELAKVVKKRVKRKRELTLEECTAIAMENHLPLRIAEKQLQLAKFRLLEAQRKLGPSGTIKWEDETGKVDGKYYAGEKFVLEGKQPLFYGGELVFSVRQAKTNIEIVRNDYESIKNELILQVKKAYYSLDKAKKALLIQRELQNRTKKFDNIAKTAYEASAISQIEFLKVSSQHNQVNFQVVSAEEDISVANLLLQQAMNVDDELEIATVPDPKIVKLGLEDCFNLAYLNRPEIKIGHLSLEYFKYETDIMKARANWPRVDFLGSYGNAREDFIQQDMDATEHPRGLGPEWYVGFKGSIPLWGSTFGYSYTKESWQPVVRTKHQTSSTTHSLTLDILNKLEDISGMQESELEYMRSVEDMNKKEQEITLEVKETFFKYKKALLLMDVAKSKVTFQERQVQILDVRRELGEAQYSDVIEEMVKLAEEKFSYIQAITDYYISIATLNKAVGISNHFEI